MAFECTSVPSKVALEVWELAEVSADLTKWKRKLKDSFGVRGTTTVRKLDDVDPSLVPLPTTPWKASTGYQMQTPDTKQVFGKTPDSPYFADSHMVTPKKNSDGRRFNLPALGDDDDDDDDTGYDFADPCEDLTAQIRRSYQREDEDGTGLSDERSLRWLKKFIYEMEGTNTQQDRWCEPFQLLMESGASNWARQLPKKTRNKWSLLCEAFMAYYCSQHDQSAEDRYYTATRDEGGGHICAYLLRLNVYARSPKIAYEAGGTIGASHVKRFLDTCEDDALVRQLIPQRFDNIVKVEAVINDTMAANRRRKDKGSTPLDVTPVGMTGMIAEVTAATVKIATIVESPSQFCTQVHGAGQCEHHKLYEEAVKDVSESTGMITSATLRETRPTPRVKVMKLLAGERQGWWSQKQFDRRKRVRALVMGAVNDRKTEILLGTGTNVSAVSESFAKKIRLRRRVNMDMQLDIQGIAKDEVYTNEPGVRLDLFRSTMKNPEEVVVPLVKSQKEVDELSCPAHFPFVYWIPHEDLPLSDGYVQLHTRKYPDETGVTDEISSNCGESDKSEEATVVSCPIDAGEQDYATRVTPQEGEFGEVRSANEVQVAYEHPRFSPDDDNTAHLISMLRQQTDGMRTLSARPDLIKGVYLDGTGGVTEPVYVTVAALQEMDDEIEESMSDDPLDDLRHCYIASAKALMVDGDSVDGDEFEHEATEIHFEDYAHELAFLPDLTAPASTILDYDAPNVKNPSLDPIGQIKLVETLRRHEEIMIASGNALPPPAYGAVCDIDVQGNAPIKQRARRIPLKYLRKLYELLKGLLEAGLIAFSSSPWASPIVIVLKKNGLDIRL
ncbi:hypothetical protein PHYSODRAFT_262607 [Phytophthora sojae]|uniref:Retrotransposon gag domain-containing protein n=1 Tax=Phytophthora sojae (strain P6497) TaxID=1094619 RepID=G4ZCE7_PHYSP|nr:hypothetical protein PHYSODRAFT_262607 [Phytophthora sojae]EGZ16440.1 hypothetical protein PHYSODRAFT_262607 [Phytophthora sojae]|eukprot:XP_009525498.1 hypothetical protein PHYSODRAFT_262607 [Phytophthora sojae]